LPTSRRFLLSVLFACAALAGPARAEVESEAVSELNAYFKLSDTFRVLASASLTKPVTETVTDGDVGAYLDVLSLKPIFGELLSDPDLAQNRYLWGRVGYSFGEIHEGDGLKDDYRDKQFVGEMTGQYPISEGLLVEGRARIEFRTLDSGRSNRYRFRIGIEKEFTLFGREMIPYARAEILYDTRFEVWNSQIYQAGANIGLTDHLRVELYYSHRTDTSVQPAHLNTVGLSLKYYR
jgi:hypothetical protein